MGGTGILMGLKKVPGGTPSGNLGVAAPVEIDDDGGVKVSEKGVTKNITVLLLEEMRAIRMGMEQWLDLEPGELVSRVRDAYETDLD